MTVKEEKLSADIKGGVFYPLYYFYGDEPFLTRTYTDRIRNSLIGDDDMNFDVFGGAVDIDKLSDSIENMPLFAENKVILISDLDCDKMTDEEYDRLYGVLCDIPTGCTVIIAMTAEGIIGGKKSNNNKLCTSLSKEKSVCCVKFDRMTSEKIARLIQKKAAKRGCVISPQNAVYLAQQTLDDLTLCSIETEKLCDYRMSGEITAEDIDKLVIKQPDASVYSLANQIATGNNKAAFMILDDLLAQRIDPIVILASLNSAYIDYYRASLARNYGKSRDMAVRDFAYAKNRAFVVDKAMRTVAGIKPDFVSRCLTVLQQTDIRMKSTSTDNKILLEKCISELFAIKEGKL